MNDKNYSVARVEQHTKASIGKSERHIERKNESYENMNVDLSRTPMNVHYQSCGDLTYNAHLDKLVEEGSISLRGLKKDAKVFDEMIFDVNTAYFEERGGYEYACRFYEEAFHFAQKEYGQENIVSAVMHADELNTALTEQLGHPVYHYHMHVVALPVVDKEVLWTRFFEHMRDAGFEDFERGERGSTTQHLSVTEFKVKKAAERLDNLETTVAFMENSISFLEGQTEEAQKKADKAQARVDKLVPKMEQIEDLARKYTNDADQVLPPPDVLESANDADQVLPPPDVLESAKSYREKKAMPLYRKIIGVLRNLFDKYLTLKHDYEDLQRKYEREIDSGNQMKKTIKRLNEEKDSQSGIVAKFYALCRGFGEEYIESQAMGILEREAMERQQKKLTRKRHDRDAR